MPRGSGAGLERDARATNVSGLTRDRPITCRFPSGFTVYPSVSRHDVFTCLEERINANCAGKIFGRPVAGRLRTTSFGFHVSGFFSPNSQSCRSAAIYKSGVTLDALAGV
jgi:hypothetical protein